MPASVSRSICALLLVACSEPSEVVLRVRREPPPTGNGARLVAYGGGAPHNLADLDTLAAAIESGGPLAFDGIVFDAGFQRVFTGTVADDSMGRAMAARLAAPPFSLFDRSLIVFEVGPADVDWGDDAAFAAVIENARRAAAVARDAGAIGFFFDTQTYFTQVFSFPDVGAGRTFTGVVALVTMRARQIMDAILAEHPDPLLVLSLGYFETWRSVCLDGVALEADRYGLLPSFLDGLQASIDAAGRGRMIDGLLPAYPITDPADVDLLYAIASGAPDSEIAALWRSDVVTFRWPIDRAVETGEIVLPATFTLTCPADVSAKLRPPTRVGFGIVLDYPESFDPVNHAANYHTPAEYRAILTRALERADELVWLWAGEVDFFGRTLRETVPLPEAYRDAILQARVVIGEP